LQDEEQAAWSAEQEALMEDLSRAQAANMDAQVRGREMG
jgi:hypothetical protein